MDPNPPFTLRKLELVQPITKRMQDGDPKAQVDLLAIILADEYTLKLAAAGDSGLLDVCREEAYALDPMEAAQKLANFTSASGRYSMLLSGLSPEQADALEAKTKAKLAARLLEESPEPPAATKPL